MLVVRWQKKKKKTLLDSGRVILKYLIMSKLVFTKKKLRNLNKKKEVV